MQHKTEGAENRQGLGSLRLTRRRLRAVALLAALAAVVLVAPWRVALIAFIVVLGAIGWRIRDAVRRLSQLAGELAGERQASQAAAAADYPHLCLARERHLVPVHEPLVLVSQIQRSGGTLLSQLLDGHPQCHAHPYELYTGYPDKTIWPVLDLAGDPDGWFNMLFEAPVTKLFREGYSKYGKGRDEKPELFPFLFPPTLQQSLFRHCVARQPPESQRDVFDCFFTSYFNAWLDNHNLYTGPKKYVTAFVPRLAMDAQQVAGFFAAYPDGRLVTIVRDPQGWYVSARRHGSSYCDLREAMAVWAASTRAALDAKTRYGSAVCVLGFTDLLSDTAGVMRRLADYLGIDFHASLLTPTFNGRPIKADSSFVVPDYGVLQAPLHRAQSELTAAEVDYIDQQAADLYAQSLAATDGHRLAA
jgi:hypothetical protein